MKRHPALVHLSHDHQHALVQARRLRGATDGPDPVSASAAFATFFAEVTVPHFREEEEELFPLASSSEEARPLIVQALLEHQQLHALARQLERSQEGLPATMVEMADVLEQHVRLEERELFPLLEQIASDDLDHREADAEGPLWGLASEDLNATLLAWRSGRGTDEQVNSERDVLIFVVDGSATVTVGDTATELRPGRALIVEKGRRRSIAAGAHGVRYLSVHLRRPPLQIRSLSQRAP